MIAKKSSTKISRSTKTKKAAAVAVADTLLLNHAEFMDMTDIGDPELIAMLASLSTPDPDEIIESPLFTEVTPNVVEMDAAMLDAAVSGAEATEAMIAQATPEGVLEGTEAPTGNTSDVVVEVIEAAPESAADAVVEGPVVKEKKTAKEKKAAIPRKHYSDKTERLKDKLGSELAGYSILTLADAGVTDAELGAKVEETMAIIKSMNGKSQIWAVKMLEWLSGRKSSISEVTGRILRLLNKDGFVQTGATGNLYLDLIAKPYSPGAARAMGGNNLAMMMFLKILVADGKGRYVANPESLLLLKANSMLFAGSEESAEEEAELAA